jgi:hypothetical protein
MTVPSNAIAHDGACGATTRGGTPCTQKAGWGTDHVGVGRCKLHGGATPIKHGRYSLTHRETIGHLIQEHRESPDPLDTTEEIAVLRALAEDYLSTKHGTENFDPETAAKLIEQVGKQVARIQSALAQNAISRKDFLRVMTEMGRAVEARVADSHVLEKIRDDWSSIRLA